MCLRAERTPLDFLPRCQPGTAPGEDGEVRTLSGILSVPPSPNARVPTRPVPCLPVFTSWEGVHGSLWGLGPILRAHRFASPLCPQSPPRSRTQVSRNPRRPGVSDEAGRPAGAARLIVPTRVSDGCWGAGLERSPQKKERTSGSRDLGGWGLTRFRRGHRDPVGCVDYASVIHTGCVSDILIM